MTDPVTSEELAQDIVAEIATLGESPYTRWMRCACVKPPTPHCENCRKNKNAHAQFQRCPVDDD